MGRFNVSRRSFLGLTGGAAVAAAGLGLVGCGGGSDSGSSGSSGSAGSEPQNGSPATTALDQLPLPQKGMVYNNPQDRDNVQDGGTLVLPVSEVGPNWNYCSAEGNTVDMMTYWQYYMPVNMVLTDATGGTMSPNPDYLESIDASEDSGKQVITIRVNPQAQFNDGTPIDYRAFQAIWTIMSGKDSRFSPSSTDGFDKIESVEKGSDDREVIVTMSEPVYPAEAVMSYVIHPSAVDPDVFENGWNLNPHAEWGAGPFTIDSVSDTQVVFVPNPKWWGTKPKLDSVTYKQMDAQAIYNAFKNGEVDATGSVSSGSAEMLSNFSSMDDAEVR
ncbi:MAG: ABC transporter substrate-binding protein, partial [Atopobiaceae bacterium]